MGMKWFEPILDYLVIGETEGLTCKGEVLWYLEGDASRC
jgi:hypothetical protein